MHNIEVQVTFPPYIVSATLVPPSNRQSLDSVLSADPNLVPENELVPVTDGFMTDLLLPSTLPAAPQLHRVRE